MTQEHRVLSTNAPLGEIQPIGSANNGGGERCLVQTVDPATPAPGASWAPRWTPGPWQMSGGRRSDVIYGHGIGPDGGLMIAAVPYSDLTPGEHIASLADARLIASAPCLYEALVEAKKELWMTARSQWAMADFKNWAVVQQIDAALTKADGKVRDPLLKATEGAGG